MGGFDFASDHRVLKALPGKKVDLAVQLLGKLVMQGPLIVGVLLDGKVFKFHDDIDIAAVGIEVVAGGGAEDGEAADVVLPAEFCDLFAMGADEVLHGGLLDNSLAQQIPARTTFDVATVIHGEGRRDLGGGVNAFSRYENGKTKPPLALVKLLRVLEKHPDLLDEVRAA